MDQCNEGVASVCQGEELAELKGKFLDPLVNLCSNPPLWSLIRLKEQDPGYKLVK